MALINIQGTSLYRLGLRCVYSELRSTFTERKISARTSGIIVIGDEVLKGQVQDINSHFLSKNLYNFGIKVLKVSVVPDDIDTISLEIKKFSKEYDFVLTTGGIGPTHDDVTYESLAKAFNLRLYYDPTITQMCFDFFKTNDMKHPSLKLALIPETSKLTFGFDKITQRKALYPNVSVKNVYVFPGVPQLCQRMFNFISSEIFFSEFKFYFKEMYLVAKEDCIANYLNKAVEKYPSVTFGSYPDFFHSYYSVKLTFESLDESIVNDAYGYLQKEIPNEYQIQYDKEPFADKKKKLKNVKNKLFFEALEVVKNCMRDMKAENIFLYFDGGKNSTLLLHMLSVVFEENFPDKQINAIYVEYNKKINNYVSRTSKNYNLNLLKFSRDNLKKFITCDRNFLLVKGTRNSDPNAEKVNDLFKGVNVLNPLAEWHYDDVWGVIKNLYLPYCELYDQGYTSITNKCAKPNVNLITDGPRKDLVYYKKAYELEDKSLENS